MFRWPHFDGQGWPTKPLLRFLQKRMSEGAVTQRPHKQYQVAKIIETKRTMKNFTTYLSTAPVVALIWFTFTAGLLIEINRFFPDPLVFSF